MAHHGQIHGTAQYHSTAVASEGARTEPVENIWQFMRDNWLSNRIFKSYDAIVAICCEPGTNSSINRGELCQSDYVSGRINDSFCKLVLDLLQKSGDSLLTGV